MSQIARRNWVVALCAVAVLLAVSWVAAQDSTTSGNVLEEWQQEELQSLVEVVSAALNGQVILPAENPFEIRTDFLKGTDGNAYVPFTVSIDPSKVNASAVAMYLFVIDPVSAQAAAQAAALIAEEPEAPDRRASVVIDGVAVDVASDEATDDSAALPPPAFENAYFTEVTVEGTDPIEVSRAFNVPGGEYDVYLAIRDSTGGVEADAQMADAASVMLLRHRVSVPNLWDGTLQTSTVLFAENLVPLDGPLSPEQQILSPYTIGTTQIEPKADRSFGKQDELSLVFLVYNPGLGDESKPDVTIEYAFFHQTADAETYFNRTQNQQFNGETLPPTFDLTLGHQIVAGQSVPLSMFPAGDYRLNIKVTDNVRSTEVIHDLMFNIRET